MGFQRSKRRAQKSKRPTKKIKEALAFSKAELAQKPQPIFFSRFVRTCHMQLDGISKIEEAIPDIGEAYAFADVSTSVTCRVSFAEITGSLSKRRFQPSAFPDVSTSVTCRVSFMEITGSLSKRRFQPFAFPDVSTSVTCRVSFTEITGNLSKISCEVEST
ncbi:hypothetical protein ACFX1T_030317 [Malus domestica]